jgi:UDP-N-acetylglucosamine acyltransferase
VGKDIPPYVLACRLPLSYGGINSVGLKRKGFTPDRINHILDIYRIIYNNGMNPTQAVEYLERQFPASPEKDEIVGFIRQSPRGIIRRYSQEKAEDEVVD